MEKTIVRIQAVELNNFRNVEHGAFRFACNTKPDIFEDGSDILGIYGQNGSGKTAFIRALSVLDALLSGDRLPEDISNYITVGKESCWLSFLFSMTNQQSYYKIKYEFCLKKRAEKDINADDQDQIPVIVAEERLSYSWLKDQKWTATQPIINYDASRNDVFSPKVRFAEMTKQNKNMVDNLRVAKKYAVKQSTSFIFAKDVREQWEGINSNHLVYKEILTGLSSFGRFNLYIIDNRSMGLIHANMLLPYNFNVSDLNPLSRSRVLVKLDGSSIIPDEVINMIQKAVETMNTVLCQIIPGLNVEIVNLGKQLMKNGKTGTIIELSSNRNQQRVPLRYESDGIKKIISILHMMILMYNNPSMTLAIDELDAGVFEYLLGEILKIINETGKGQLIFTSHNLRPLETLHKKSIIFTTANPDNRYIRLANVKTNNNFRDLYYHDLILGGQKECIYDTTNSFTISRAFRMAGDHNGS